MPPGGFILDGLLTIEHKLTDKAFEKTGSGTPNVFSQKVISLPPQRAAGVSFAASSRGQAHDKARMRLTNTTTIPTKKTGQDRQRRGKRFFCGTATRVTAPPVETTGTKHGNARRRRPTQPRQSFTHPVVTTTTTTASSQCGVVVGGKTGASTPDWERGSSAVGRGVEFRV